MRILHSSALLLFAVTSAAGSPGALAGPHADSARSAVVSYADLDLSKEAGTATLYRRIQRAALRVCRPEDPYFYFEAQRARVQCYRLTVADAVARVDSPVLTDLHRSRTAKARR